MNVARDVCPTTLPIVVERVQKKLKKIGSPSYSHAAIVGGSKCSVGSKCSENTSKFILVLFPTKILPFPTTSLSSVYQRATTTLHQMTLVMLAQHQ